MLEIQHIKSCRKALCDITTVVTILANMRG